MIRSRAHRTRGSGRAARQAIGGAGGRIATAVVLAAVLVAPALARDPLAGVPHPNLELLDQAVARQLRERRAEVEQLIAAGGVGDSVLAEALGALGGLYYLYDYVDLSGLCLVEAEALEPADARWPYLRGLGLKLDGDLEGAEAALLRASRLDATNPTVRVRLGDVWFDLGRADQAEASYRKALELDPDRPAAHYGLGRISLARGDYETAIRSFERAVLMQPAATSIHHQIGMAYRELGDLESARSHLALNTGGRVRVIDQVIDSVGRELQSTNQAFTAGIRAMRAGKFEEASRLFLAARVEQPDDHLVEYNLALAYLRTDHRDQGMEALRRSIEKKPDFRNGHFNLGSLLAQVDRHREAEIHFGRAHEIDPEDHAAHLEWATALSRTGQSERAATEFERLVVKTPRLMAAWVRLGALQLNAGRADAARASFDRVLDGDADPEERAEAHMGLGRLAQARGDRSVAVEHFDAAIRQVPDADSHLVLATALGRAGRFTEAAQAFSKVIDSRPEALEPHFGRAMALLLGQSYPAAREALENSLELQVGSLPLRHLYSRLLATAPDPGVRDGGRALEIATEVFRASQTLDHAETMAMALAETGRFEEALDMQRRVVAEAERARNANAARAAKNRLELYEREEPCRAPWLGG